MIIKLLLTVGLLVALTYSWVQQARMRLLKLAMASFVAMGMFFVWFPDQSNRIAHLVGVGRGADLILYCWIMVTLIIILNLYLKTRRLEAAITKLVRHIAVREAKSPE